MKDIKQSCD